MKTFINVAQMKLAHLVAGQQVETTGYYAAGDGGGARYLVKANEAVDNFGNHDLAGTTVAVLQDKGSPNVWQFGAVHDGVVDDTTFFDAAWLASNPKFVEVPAASYEIPGTVTGSFYSFGLVTIVTGTVNTIHGIAELATQAEVNAGTDTMKYVSPSGLVGAFLARGVEKSSNETINTDTVLSDDADLTLPLVIGTYEVEFLILFYATTTAGMGFQYRLNYTGTLTRSIRLPISRRFNGTDDRVLTLGVINQTTNTGNISTSSVSADYTFEKATIVVSTAGVLSIQWAQNSSEANNLNVLSGSYLKVTRIG